MESPGTNEQTQQPSLNAAKGKIINDVYYKAYKTPRAPFNSNIAFKRTFYIKSHSLRI